MKNLNSFNFVRKGLEHEEIRQAAVLRAGGVIGQETRRYDETSNSTILMRVKEGSDDYRYFPEPDLTDLYIDEDWKARIRAEIPELPDVRKKRYVEDLGLPAYDAAVLTITKEMSDFFEATVKAGADAKLASNWLMGEVSAFLKAEQKELEDLAVKAGPKGVYAWIYGSNSPMTEMAPGSWQEVGITDPLVGLKQILDGIRQMQGLK